MLGAWLKAYRSSSVPGCWWQVATGVDGRSAGLVGEPAWLADAAGPLSACACMSKACSQPPEPHAASLAFLLRSSCPPPALPPACSTAQIKAGQEAEAIEYGRTHVVPLLDAPPGGSDSGGGGSSSVTAADRELLEDATALLAYDDPATGPTGGWVEAHVLLGLKGPQDEPRPQQV